MKLVSFLPRPKPIVVIDGDIPLIKLAAALSSQGLSICCKNGRLIISQRKEHAGDTSSRA